MLLFMRRAANSSVAAASVFRRRFDRIDVVALPVTAASFDDQRVEFGALGFVQQFAVRAERGLRRFHQTLRVHLRLAQRAGAHVDFGRREAVFAACAATSSSARP